MNKKYKHFLLFTGILLALSLMISASYALYIFTIGQEGENVVESDCLKITFNDTKPLSISETIPLSEDETDDIEPYTFEIKNICNHPINYKINIETLDTTTMDLKAIRVKLDENESKLLGSIPNNKSNYITNSNALSSKTINKGDLDANNTKTFNLKAWIDKDATFEQSANKTFASKVVVSATLRAAEMAQLISGPLLNKTFKQLAGIEYTQAEEEEFEEHISLARIVKAVMGENGEEEFQKLIEEGYFAGNVPSYQDFKSRIQTVLALGPSILMYTEDDCNIYNMLESWDSSVTSIEFSKEPPKEGIETRVISTSDSPIEAVAWIENNVIYIYSEEETVSFNPNSSYAFEGFKKLRNIDFDHFDFTNVRSINGLFMASYVNDDYIDAINPINTEEFEFIFSMSYVDISDYSIIDMSTVTDITGMFFGAYLVNGNLGQMKTSNISNMSLAFSGLQVSSEEHDISKDDASKTIFNFNGLDTSNVTNMYGLFYESDVITNLDLRSFNTSKVTNMAWMFVGMKNLTSIDLTSLDTSNVTDMSAMFAKMSSLTSLDLSNFNTSNVTDMSRMFSGMSSLTSINLTPLDTSNVTNMSGMFDDMSGLTSIDLTPLNTSNVTDMSNMFKDTKLITSLDLSHFDTSKVTDMSAMFSGMSGLTSLNLSSFDTSNVTSMYSMFSGMSNLTSLNLSSFDTSKVTYMYNMFANLKGLTSLGLSNFDTSNVTDMSAMFSGMSNLTSLDVSHFDTQNVIDMSYMFSGMTNLTSLDVIHFDTSKVTNMSDMFYGTHSLTNLDVSHFDTSKVTNMSSMFSGMSTVKTIYVGTSWNTSAVTSSSYMFNYDTKLVGGAGTKYTSSHVDKEYARVDDPTNGKPGYFTLKTN